mgnify:CR=1 FL=1
MISLILFGLFLLFLVTSVPVAISLGLAATGALLFSGGGDLGEGRARPAGGE